MNIAMAKMDIQLPTNSLARIAQRDPSARRVLNDLAASHPLPVQIRAVAEPATEDYTQIDPNLSIGEVRTTQAIPPPTAGLGYAGLTPTQRRQFLIWLDAPTAPAPLLFQQLYLAYLEVALFEGGRRQQQARQELRHLADADTWQGHEGLARTALLGCWLAQDGEGFIEWVRLGQMPAGLLGMALGWQALCHTALTVKELAALLVEWQIAAKPPTQAVLALRLNSLTANLNAEPLRHALLQLGVDGQVLRPWRTHHRDLRLTMPQPDVRPVLEPLLHDLVAVMDVEEQPAATLAATKEPVSIGVEDLGWHLVLEFGHSRSDLFTFALTIAQRLPTFVQILDENRRLIYRVVFKKSEMRSFWRLWDYVQSWSSTHVYLNGAEVEKWKVYPYSQFLR